jgi:hypothetical protein
MPTRRALQAPAIDQASILQPSVQLPKANIWTTKPADLVQWWLRQRGESAAAAEETAAASQQPPCSQLWTAEPSLYYMRRRLKTPLVLMSHSSLRPFPFPEIGNHLAIPCVWFHEIDREEMDGGERDRCWYL